MLVKGLLVIGARASVAKVLPLAQNILFSTPEGFNSSRQRNAYVFQWIGFSLFGAMACRQCRTKPLTQPKMTDCQLDPKKNISWKFHMKIKSFHSRKCIWKHCKMLTILSLPQCIESCYGCLLPLLFIANRILFRIYLIHAYHPICLWYFNSN